MTSNSADGELQVDQGSTNIKSSHNQYNKMAELFTSKDELLYVQKAVSCL